MTTPETEPVPVTAYWECRAVLEVLPEADEIQAVGWLAQELADLTPVVAGWHAGAHCGELAECHHPLCRAACEAVPGPGEGR